MEGATWPVLAVPPCHPPSCPYQLHPTPCHWVPLLRRGQGVGMAWCSAPSSPEPGPRVQSKDPLRHKSRAVARKAGPPPWENRTAPLWHRKWGICRRLRPGQRRTEGHRTLGPQTPAPEGAGSTSPPPSLAKAVGRVPGTSAPPWADPVQGPPHPSRGPPPSRPHQLPRGDVLTADSAGAPLGLSPPAPPRVLPHQGQQSHSAPEQSPRET